MRTAEEIAAAKYTEALFTGFNFSRSGEVPLIPNRLVGVSVPTIEGSRPLSSQSNTDPMILFEAVQKARQIVMGYNLFRGTMDQPSALAMPPMEAGGEEVMLYPSSPGQAHFVVGRRTVDLTLTQKPIQALGGALLPSFMLRIHSASEAGMAQMDVDWDQHSLEDSQAVNFGVNLALASVVQYLQLEGNTLAERAHSLTQKIMAGIEGDAGGQLQMGSSPEGRFGFEATRDRFSTYSFKEGFFTDIWSRAIDLSQTGPRLVPPRGQVPPSTGSRPRSSVRRSPRGGGGRGWVNASRAGAASPMRALAR